MLQSVIRTESDSLFTIHPLKLRAAPSRVVIRPFHLGWQASNSTSSRAEKLVLDVLALGEDEVRDEYNGILSDFSGAALAD